MRNKIRTIVNILIAVMVFGAWIAIVVSAEGALTDTGLRSLKYFTVLSNLLAGIASIIWLVTGSTGMAVRPLWVERFKYVAAAAVMLTFMTVMLFLGPLYGYLALLEGGNLFLHMLVPLAAGAEIIFLSDADYTRKDNDLTLIPPLVYACGYLGNIFVNGIGEWPDTNDWYLFLTWGWPVGILIFAMICLVTWLIGLLLRKLKIRHRIN